MDADVKKKWIKALKKGEVNGKPVVQTKGFLRNTSKVLVEEGEHKGKKAAQLCCLGVLCEIAVAEGVIPKPVKRVDGYGYGSESATALLPVEVREWAGLNDSGPEVEVKDEETEAPYHEGLATLNDEYEDYNFKKIAKAIKKSL